MTMFKIYDPDGYYTTSYFIYTSNGEIYADNKEIGFFKHPTIKTMEDLARHINEMSEMGLVVDVYY